MANDKETKTILLDVELSNEIDKSIKKIQKLINKQDTKDLQKEINIMIINLCTLTLQEATQTLKQIQQKITI